MLNWYLMIDSFDVLFRKKIYSVVGVRQFSGEGCFLSISSPMGSIPMVLISSQQLGKRNATDSREQSRRQANLVIR